MRYRLTLAGLVLAVAASARATLLVYEPFDYPTGVLAAQSATGQNLTGTYTSGSAVPDFLELRAESPSLGYGALLGAPGFSGARLSQNQGTTAASAVVALASPVSIAPDSAIFFSALFLFDDSTNGNRFARIEPGESVEWRRALLRGVRGRRDGRDDRRDDGGHRQ